MVVMLMVCTAGHQSQVKGHSAKHSHREMDADRRNDTLASSPLLPVSLWDFTELCKITVCMSFSLMLLSQWPDWLMTPCITGVASLYPHICDSYIFAGVHTHKHMHLHKRTHNLKETEVRRKVVKFSALAISHPCCEQLWCRSAGNLREKNAFF